MSVGVHGAGGGKIIRDATATPDKVKTGEIFYNNDGRQIGTGIELRKQIINLSGRPSDIESIGFGTKISYDIFEEPDSAGFARITGTTGTSYSQYYTHEFSYSGRLVYITHNTDNKKYLILPYEKRGYKCVGYGINVFGMDVLVDDVNHKVYLVPKFTPYPDLTGKQFTLHLED